MSEKHDHGPSHLLKGQYPPHFGHNHLHAAMAEQMNGLEMVVHLPRHSTCVQLGVGMESVLLL